MVGIGCFSIAKKESHGEWWGYFFQTTDTSVVGRKLYERLLQSQACMSPRDGLGSGSMHDSSCRRAPIAAVAPRSPGPTPSRIRDCPRPEERKPRPQTCWNYSIDEKRHTYKLRREQSPWTRATTGLPRPVRAIRTGSMRLPPSQLPMDRMAMALHMLRSRRRCSRSFHLRCRGRCTKECRWSSHTQASSRPRTIHRNRDSRTLTSEV